MIILKLAEHYASLCSLSDEPITVIRVRRTLPGVAVKDAGECSSAGEDACQVLAATGAEPEIEVSEVVQGL